MLKMGVKKKHEHENGYDNLLTESAKSNHNPQTEWLHYKDPASANEPRQMNSESNFLELAHGIGTTNDTRSIYSGSKHSVLNDSMKTNLKRNNKIENVYDKMYEHENMMNSIGENKYNKHTSYGNSVARSHHHRYNHQSNQHQQQQQKSTIHSNSESNTIVISDEDTDDEEQYSRSHVAPATNDYRSGAFLNGHHSKRSSDDVVDIGDVDGTNDVDDDEDEVIEVGNGTNGYGSSNGYDNKKSSKTQNHQSHRQNKNDFISKSTTSTNNATNDHKSSDRTKSSESLVLEIEQASTIRPQGTYGILCFYF